MIRKILILQFETGEKEESREPVMTFVRIHGVV